MGLLRAMHKLKVLMTLRQATGKLEMHHREHETLAHALAGPF